MQGGIPQDAGTYTLQYCLRGNLVVALWKPTPALPKQSAHRGMQCLSRVICTVDFPPGLAETVCDVMRGIAGSLWHGHATDCNPCSGTKQQMMLHHAA